MADRGGFELATQKTREPGQSSGPGTSNSNIKGSGAAHFNPNEKTQVKLDPATAKRAQDLQDKIQALEQRITIRSNERRKQLQQEHPGQFVPNFAINEDSLVIVSMISTNFVLAEDEQIQVMQEDIGKLQNEVRQIYRDKEKEAGMGPSKMDETLGICQKIAQMSVAGFNDVAKLIILVSTSAALQLVILLASNLFNEMTVTSALYQFGLILFPEVTNWVCFQIMSSDNLL